MPTQNSESLDSSSTSQPWMAMRTFMSTAAKVLLVQKSRNPGALKEASALGSPESRTKASSFIMVSNESLPQGLT